MQFWERVKSEIRAENTTQEWVANHTGISPNTFRGWMAKKVLPNADQAYAIAKALGTTVEYLVTGETEVRNITPMKLRGIVEDLSILPEDQLQVVGLQAKLMADAVRAQAGRNLEQA